MILDVLQLYKITAILLVLMNISIKDHKILLPPDK